MDDVRAALRGDHEAAKLTHLSLFSGIGGLDLAAEMAGFRTVGQCEWADYPTKVLEKHWPDVPRWRDIRTLTGESFYEKTGLRTVDVISGGSPASHIASLGKDWQKTMIGICGQSSSELYGKSSQSMLLVKMLMASYQQYMSPFAPIWKQKATKSGRSVFRLVLSERTMKDTGFVFLASPRASQDFKPIRKQTPKEHSGKHGQTMCSSLGIICPERIGQYINPQFAEWMMGFPIGWGDIRSTKSGCNVTETP